MELHDQTTPPNAIVAVIVESVLSGTQGLVGAPDTIWIIKRNASGTTLHVRGRDVEESEKAVEFNKSTCRWTILGSAEEVHRSNERTRVLSALREAGAALSVSEIIASGQLRNRNAADLLLGKMARDGEVERAGRGLYTVPATTGQIGQTERFDGQDADITQENVNLSNLSDLSGAGERTEAEPLPHPNRRAQPTRRTISESQISSSAATLPLGKRYFLR